MPAVFVHGVPETFRTWDAVRAEIARDDTIALALPGFTTPFPDDTEPTKEFFVDWVIRELEAVGEPVDLVGHDWGSLITQRVVSTRPDLIRTWACGSGPVDDTYVWHDTAQAWQTPEVGEQVMEMMTPDMLAVALVGELGEQGAADMAQHVDATMKRVILGLYRSAVTVGAEWQPEVEALGNRLPCTVIWGRDDSYAPPEFGRRLAERVGAEYVELDCGHFWPVLRPQQAAAALERLWAR